MVVHFDRLKPCHLNAVTEERGQAPVTNVAENTLPSPLPLPGTTLDIIQPETMDTAEVLGNSSLPY